MARIQHFDLRILLLGNDSTLLWTRELVLKRAGYAVYAALASEFPEIKIECDIVVLCRSIPIQAAEALAVAVKSDHPSTCILRLSTSTSSHDEFFDVVFDPTRGPAKLLAEVETLRHSLHTAKEA